MELREIKKKYQQAVIKDYKKILLELADIYLLEEDLFRLKMEEKGIKMFHPSFYLDKKTSKIKAFVEMVSYFLSEEKEK